MLLKSMRSVLIVYKYARVATIAFVILMIFSAILTSLQFSFTQHFVDNTIMSIHTSANMAPMILWGGLLVVSILFNSVNGYFNSLIDISLTRSLTTHFVPAILNKFRQLDYACFEDSSVHDIIKRMSSNPQDKIKQNFILSTNILRSCIALGGILIYFYSISTWFALGYIIVMGATLILEFKSMKMMNHMMLEQSIDERRMDYLGNLLTDKHAVYELKIFNAISFVINQWRMTARNVLKDRLLTTIKAQKLFLLSSILMSLWALYLMLFISWGVQHDQYSLGLLIAMVNAIGQIFSISEQLSFNYSRATKSAFEIQYFDHFMTLPEREKNGALSFETPKIVFEDVHFTYPGTEIPILKGVSFTILPGEKIALVGKNGAGKSTIIKLLSGLYKPTKGRITIGDQDLFELSDAAKRGALSFVFQDYANYSLTVRENVAFGCIEQLHNDSKIVDALENGQIAELFSSKLDVNLGKLEEDGIDLSGGQWQRLAVSRALFSPAAFIVLDEPTASMDPIAESQMYETFMQVLNSRGVIIISHRLASAKMADHIMVLDEGKIIEIGHHEALLNKGGAYSQMFKAQAAWYGEDISGEN